jgi:7-keto-8-aminopelargonate synthetase-like enzyme
MVRFAPEDQTVFRSVQSAHLDDLQDQARAHLADLAAQGRLRHRAQVVSNVAVNLSSNDYLGLGHAPALRKSSIEATERYGTGSGASVIVDSKHDLCEQLQDTIAEFIPTGWQSVFATSGYAANAAFFDLLRFYGDDVEIFIDHRAHASLISGAKLSGLPVFYFSHNNSKSLEDKLIRSERRYKIVVVESLHSMDGTFESAEVLARCCNKTPGTFLYVDEAHSAGLYPGLSWTFAAHHWNKLAPYVVGVMLGCGKTLAASGGLLVLPKVFSELAYQMARTIMFTTAAPPANIATVQAAVIELRRTGELRRAELQRLLQQFADRVRNNGVLDRHVMSPVDDGDQSVSMSLVRSPILSIVGLDLTKLTALHRELLHKGYKTALIRTPTVPKGQERIRLSFSVSATKSFCQGDAPVAARHEWPIQLADLLASLVAQLKSEPETI